MSVVGKHWGALSPRKVDDHEEIWKNITNTEKQNVTLEFEPLFQPCHSETLVKEELSIPAERCPPDKYVMHTIQLLQHIYRLRDLINGVQSYMEAYKKSGDRGENEVTQIFPQPPLPPEEFPRDHEKTSTLPFLEKSSSPFSLGIGEKPPRVSSSTCRQMLRKAVITLLAHAGYDSSKSTPLETLTDVTAKFLSKFTLTLRAAVDKETLEGTTGFPDAMERTFHDMGFGNITVLHDFYQQRVISYHASIEQLYQSLMENYEELRQPKVGQMPVANSVYSQDEEEEVVPLIHFPVLGEEGEEGFQPSLEKGFQMLQSLEEQEVQAGLQSLDPEEEIINVSDSPAQGSQDGIAASDSTPTNATTPDMPSSTPPSGGSHGRSKKRRRK